MGKSEVDIKMKIIKSIKNTVRGFRKKGFIQIGATTYVQIKQIKDCEMLLDKNIVITGGGSGIGYAIAKRCISMGAKVLITGRNANKLENAAKELGNNCKFLVHDVGDISQLEKAVSQIINIFDGRIDALVNNAGISNGKKFDEVTEEDWNTLVNVLLKGPYFLTQRVYQEMLGQKSGNIVMISSNGGVIGHTKPYGILKAGINNFVCGLAKEGARYGIRCNGVAPGYTISSIQKEFELNTEGNLYKPDVIDSRWHLAEEMAEVVCFLLSERSVCLNGQVLVCDGGDTLV